MAPCSHDDSHRRDALSCARSGRMEVVNRDDAFIGYVGSSCVLAFFCIRWFAFIRMAQKPFSSEVRQ